ncbi:TetR/AcrR family transcriptional regulator [Burkholderia sp. Ac-20345]|nr:TetR/AcrR family transcriptional regulator [Burkholderia sp. Ac-20345]
MTRAENRARTRRRLLDAAALRIVEKGFAATSVEDIVAQAGYTRGAFYSNFSNKHDLFVELLRADHQDLREAVQALLCSAPPGKDLHMPLALLVERYYHDDGNYIIWAEARLLAMRDASFRQHLNVLYVERRELIARFIERCCGRLGMQFSRSYAGHALASIALLDGIHYFRMTIPEALPNEPAGKILNNVLMRMLVAEWMLDMPGHR